jgi:mono/diheme cytochrome c family protein
MAGLSRKSTVRAAAGLALLLAGLAFLPGCDSDGYPADMVYPPRTDLLVVKRPDGKPERLDRPGELNSWFQGLKTKPGAKVYDPTTLSSSWRASLEGVLQETFGTPSHPKVGDVADSAGSQFDKATLEHGSRLYRRHCLHCHGLSGDGRGPTAPWVNPHPRDYRQGKFKFTSSAQSEGTRKPRREDLLRTLRQGIDGTSMPSFALLDQEELEALASYVTHLSLRGQTEFEVLTSMLDDSGDSLGKELERLSGSEVKEPIQERVGTRLKVLWKYWQGAEADPILLKKDPPAYAGKPLNELTEAEQKELQASVLRGYNEFLMTGTGKCLQCHNNFGRVNDYLFDDWGTIVRPANLTTGVYRGGRRPLDLYYRIYGGIAGAGMPAHDTALTAEQTWDIVNFLQVLPYERMLPEEARKGVYGR